MSDLQDLIHTNAHNAYEIGIRTERERISELLKDLQTEFHKSYQLERYIAVAVKRINE